MISQGGYCRVGIAELRGHLDGERRVAEPAWNGFDRQHALGPCGGLHLKDQAGRQLISWRDGGGMTQLNAIESDLGDVGTTATS